MLWVIVMMYAIYNSRIDAWLECSVSRYDWGGSKPYGMVLKENLDYLFYYRIILMDDMLQGNIVLFEGSGMGCLDVDYRNGMILDWQLLEEIQNGY